jgi:hypothetical protein
MVEETEKDRRTVEIMAVIAGAYPLLIPRCWFFRWSFLGRKIGLIFSMFDVKRIWWLRNKLSFNSKNYVCILSKSIMKFWQSQNLPLVIINSSCYNILLFATTHPRTVVRCFSLTLFHAKTGRPDSSFSDNNMALRLGEALVVAGLDTFILITAWSGICPTELFARHGHWTFKTTTKIWCMKKTNPYNILNLRKKGMKGTENKFHIWLVNV